MAEAKVVRNLAEVCASGAEVYSAWTTAKAVVQRRYLSTKTQGRFEDCAELLVSLTRVLRTYLRIDLAQELFRDVLFQVMEHFSAMMGPGAAVAGLGDDGASQPSFDALAASFLQRVFDTLVSATTCTYTLTGPLPLVVEWNTEADDGGVDVTAAQQQQVAPWVEFVVLEFATRAAVFLSQRPNNTDALSRWSLNLFLSYQNLLSLRLAHPISCSPAPSPPLPVLTLAAQLLRMSIFSEASGAGEGSANVDWSAPTPAVAAVYWLTHLAHQPNAVNHLFAQYVYFDILRRGLQRSSTAAVPQRKGEASATLSHDRVSAALKGVCMLTPRGAILMARNAVETYRQAFPNFLQHRFSYVTTGGIEDDAVDPAYAHLYKWIWFLDSLTLVLTYSSACREGGGVRSGDPGSAEAQQRVCAHLLDTYAAVTAELPQLNWKELVTAYINL
ncbi:hypothetical protein JKF63_00222 [Porcisia hertigi]|uniref:Uncharacterized protein n=1 Tax=Porcisia hertigi TaxID=2761500 RepID=A0A836L6M7_9TRYP|nr:hypothetical protein JKF63_00222 [Porcisia hertigi]